MSQVKKGNCVQEFAPKTDLARRLLPSHLSQINYALCKEEIEPARRTDVAKQIYGSGTAKAGSSKLDIWGLPKRHACQYESFNTSHGNVLLPSVGTEEQYMPSSKTLDFLKEGQGTRLPALPDRYFR